MARLARIKGKSRVYHVIVRGINHQNIFQDEEDKGVFLDRVTHYKTRGRFIRLDSGCPRCYSCSIGGCFHMPREARTKSKSGIYHVMLRGINRQTIFIDEEDCEKYLQCITDCKAISGFALYAYCLMGNHIHLLLKEEREPLEQIFKRIGARFV